jgi:hypothetical protein
VKNSTRDEQRSGRDSNTALPKYFRSVTVSATFLSVMLVMISQIACRYIPEQINLFLKIFMNASVILTIILN